MANQIGAAKMRELGDSLKKQIPGLGFALFVFEFHKPGMANYISNAQRETMLKAMKEAYHRLSGGKEIQTPEEN